MNENVLYLAVYGKYCWLMIAYEAPIIIMDFAGSAQSNACLLKNLSHTSCIIFKFS